MYILICFIFKGLGQVRSSISCTCATGLLSHKCLIIFKKQGYPVTAGKKQPNLETESTEPKFHVEICDIVPFFFMFSLEPCETLQRECAMRFSNSSDSNPSWPSINSFDFASACTLRSQNRHFSLSDCSLKGHSNKILLFVNSTTTLSFKF